MAITYTWEIESLKTRNSVGSDGVTLNNAVIEVSWKKIGTDENGNVGRYSGNSTLTPSDVSSADFIPFESLTEDIVVGWVQQFVTGAFETAVNNKIQSIIESRMNPTQTPDLPWS